MAKDWQTELIPRDGVGIVRIDTQGKVFSVENTRKQRVCLLFYKETQPCFSKSRFPNTAIQNASFI